ncbi:MAG: 2-oxo acid dehydrogenase subunit E2 [Desulfobacterales bacterium]|nr:2-oxo acid dehydrogenase subunit E2 [Desulfobacterales bacterium]
MRFHDRPDGVLLTKLSRFRKMWPFMMPSRMEAAVYTSRRVRLHSLLTWLDRINATREDKLTLFHVILASAVRMLALQPDLNRFVAGRRIYQRRTIDISFVTRREMTEQSTETVVKLTFDPYSTIETIAEQVNTSIRGTKKSTDIPRRKNVQSHHLASPVHDSFPHAGRAHPRLFRSFACRIH